jgi:hypothetical protein
MTAAAAPSLSLYFGTPHFDTSYIYDFVFLFAARCALCIYAAAARTHAERSAGVEAGGDGGPTSVM